jgi:hypothetical protein
VSVKSRSPVSEEQIRGANPELFILNPTS